MMGEEKHETRAVFTAALALTAPEDRARYLDEACRDKPELRQRIEALLRAHDQAGGFLEDHSPDATADALQEAPGTVIGRYKLLEQIGEGAFGRVFMAEQTEPVHRKVALKIVKAGMDTREVIARFEAERQALALMDHPNIAKILDAGVTGGLESEISNQKSQIPRGRPYFVMELVRGIPITAYCDQQQLSTAERLQLFMKVCAAVQHAHQKGIIHRDLKPTNILVTVIDGEPVPKVIDFGVAKALGQKLTEKTLFTAFQQMIGTPAYMSPEQAALSGVDVDTRSDIYSLGVLLYELLTGVTPFDADTLRKAALDEIRRLIQEAEPPKPSTRLTELAKKQKAESRNQKWREVHGDLDWIVMKALEKDRARRYDTAGALGEDLQHHLQHQPVKASPPSTVYRARKFIRRHRFGVAMATGLTLALAAGLTAALIGFEQARRERDRAQRLAKAEALQRQRAEAREKQAEREAARSAQVAQFMKDMLKGAAPHVALGRDTTMLRDILDETAARLGRDLKGQPEVEADLRAVLGDAYHDLGQWSNAVAMHRKVVEIRRGLHGNMNCDVASSLRELGNDLNFQGRYSAAVAMHREALMIQTNLLGPEHLEVAETLRRLGGVLKAMGKDDEAEAKVREALAMRRRLLGDKHVEVADSLHFLGMVLRHRGKLTEAETTHRKELAMLRELGNEDLRVAGSLCFLGLTLQRLGKNHEAEVCLREAVALQKIKLGKTRSLYVSLSSLSNLLRAQHRLAESETYLREILAILINLPELDPNRIPVIRQQLAEALRDQGKLAEARQVDVDALAAQEKTPGQTNSLRRQALSRLAVLSASTANWQQSLEDCQKLLAVAPDDIWAHRLAALTALLAGQPQACHDQCLFTLSRFGDTTNGWFAEVTARTCLLTPDPALDLAQVLRLADYSLSQNQKDDWRRLAKGEAEYRLGDYQEAIRDLQPAALHLEAPIAWAAGYFLAMAHHQLNRSTEAQAGLQRANQRFAECLVQLALAPNVSACFDPASVIVFRAEAEKLILGREVSPPVDTQTLLTLRSSSQAIRQLQARAAMARETNDWTQAETLLRDALGRSTRLFGDTHREVARLLVALADLLREQGKLAEAEALYYKALQMQRELLRKGHPDVAGSLSRLVVLHSVQGQWAKAVRLLRQAEASGGAWALNPLAWLLATCPDPQVRDGPSAVRFATKAVAGSKRKDPWILSTLAVAYAEAGQFTNAVNVQKEAITLLEDEQEKEDFAAGVKLFTAGVPYRDDGLLAKRSSTLLAEGKFAEAEPVARECLALREKQIPDNWRAFNARSLLGRSLLGQKKYAEAEPLLLAGYQGMKEREAKIPAAGRPNLKEAIQRLAQLYEATNRPDEAAEWKQKLADFEKTEAN